MQGLGTGESVRAQRLGARTDKTDGAPRGERFNILLILTDQRSGMAMSEAGRRKGRTSGMNRLAAQGVRFDRAYGTFPLVVRASDVRCPGRPEVSRLVSAVLDFCATVCESAGVTVESRRGMSHRPLLHDRDVPSREHFGTETVLRDPSEMVNLTVEATLGSVAEDHRRCPAECCERIEPPAWTPSRVLGHEYRPNGRRR